MTRNIDKLAERARNENSPWTELKETFLQSRPRSQWSPYLDETAKDLTLGIAVGNTDLDAYNFPREVGPLYRDGLIAATDDYSDLPETLTVLDETDLGRMMFLFNRLSCEITRSDTGLENIERAVTAVLEKILSESGESRFTPQFAGESNSTADILIQMLSDPHVVDQVEDVIEKFEDTYHNGLLAKLDNPQMMTPLWEHQRDAVTQWLAAGSRGYVDMATATGKTVLGLAAIAAHYGSLHPLDSDVDSPTTDQATQKAAVLVVAHNDLILEQWRREFDRHLSIPPDRTQGSDDVELTWGQVHFRTAQTLLNQDRIEYDLVVLDEAHHYASGTGWGQLLDEFDNHVLALSGSVDIDGEQSSRVRSQLESRIGPECKRYTLAQARNDGVIPTFDWTVEYTGSAGTGGEFAEITEKATTQFRNFRDRVERGDLDVSTDRRLETFEDVRRYSHTTEGEPLKQSDDQFRDTVTTLFSRRTQRWNQSPAPEAVVDVVMRFSDRKVVVLTNNNAQVAAIRDELSNRSDIDSGAVYTVTSAQSSREQRDTVDQFDVPDEPAMLIGTGDLIGEGVDMHHVDVGINMATGSVNKQLIQRIGRVLRNPGTDKRAHFVNLVGVPIDPGAQVPAEDGQRLVENAQKFKGFGSSFANDPVFAVGDRTDAASLTRLLDGGYDRIRSLDEEGLYEWPDAEFQRKTLEQFLTAIGEHSSAKDVFRAWSGGSRTSRPARDDAKTDDHLVLTVVNDETSVESAFVSVAGESVTTHGRTDATGEVRFSGVREDCCAGIHTPTGDVSYVDIELTSEQTTDLVIDVTESRQLRSEVTQ